MQCNDNAMLKYFPEYWAMLHIVNDGLNFEFGLFNTIKYMADWLNLQVSTKQIIIGALERENFSVMRSIKSNLTVWHYFI